MTQIQIKAQDVADLRKRTGLSIMECKRALEEAGGDENKAIEILKKRGLNKAEKKSDRATETGIIESYTHGGRIGVLVEVLCETDFVVRNDEFRALAHDIALHIAAMSPKYVSSDSIPDEIIEAEKSRLHAELAASGKPAEIIEKIVAGKLQKFYAEICLLNQPFVKDQDMAVSDVIVEKIAKIGEKISVSRFDRFEIGQSE